MINKRVKILGSHIDSAILREGKKSEKVDKHKATEEFLTDYLDGEIYKYGMKEIEGTDKKYKFVIRNKNKKYIIENVREDDPCFALLDYASTVKIDIERRIKGAIALIALTVGLTILYKGEDIFSYFGNNDNKTTKTVTETEIRNYKSDFELLRKYFIKLIKSNITNAELVDFLEIVNYYLDKGTLSDDDVLIFERYKREIEAYSSYISDYVNSYHK